MYAPNSVHDHAVLDPDPLVQSIIDARLDRSVIKHLHLNEGKQQKHSGPSLANDLIIIGTHALLIVPCRSAERRAFNLYLH